MSGIRGVLVGALGLAALQTVIGTDRGSSGFASIVQVPGQWALAFMDPKKPLLPNFAKAPCAERGDMSLFSFLTAAAQTPAAPNISPLPNFTTPPSTTPPSTTPPVTALMA